MSFSISQLKQLSENNPEELAKLINNNISEIFILSDALELLGESSIDESIVLPIFKRMLKHIHVNIRESALLAISSFYINKKPDVDILDRVKNISKNDPSYDLRDLATDCLKKFEDLA